MQPPEYRSFSSFNSLEEWEEWIAEYRPKMYEYWAWLAKRRFHAMPEEKGVPVAGTGVKRYHSKKNRGKSGVIGGSRMLPHRYTDEGDKGKGHNRHIKRVERRMWLSEAQEEHNTPDDSYSVRAWFSEDYDEDQF
jgi:hypothetical protein